MTTEQISGALKTQLLLRDFSDPQPVVLDELGVRHGSARIDVAVVNGLLHGYEIKTERDSLRRLPNQLRAYNEVFDRATLVVGTRHLVRAEAMLPDWWGIQRIRICAKDRVGFELIRTALPNPELDPLSVTKLLWREEALAFLATRGGSRGVRSKPRIEIYRRIVNTAPLCDIQNYVRQQLRFRSGWRSEALSRSGAD